MKHTAARRLPILFGLAAALVVALAALSIAAARGPGPAPPATRYALSGAKDSPPGRFFVHQATDANTTWHTTYFSHELTDDDPDALLLATQNWNPGGGLSGVYNDHPIAMRYSGERWGIYHQDDTQIPEFAAFNVLIPHQDAIVFLHLATDDNTFSACTDIDHPATNDRTDVLLFVTPNFSPGGVDVGVTNVHPLLVAYYAYFGKWRICNANYEDLPVGTAYNVLVRRSNEYTFVHHATSLNTASNWTDIDHPLTNDNPNAILMVTQNYSAMPSEENPHEIGVWYNSIASGWAIFNQDGVGMTLDAPFNVLVRPPFTVFLPLVARQP